MLHSSVLQTLERTPTVLRALLEGMPVEAVEAQGPEGWSARDVVAHLLSIHYAANVQRVKWILASDNPVVPNVDEDAILESSGMRIWPLPTLLDEYTAARAESLVWLRALAPDDFARTGRHEVAGLITVADVLHHIAYHDLIHIAQVATLLSIPVELRRGRMREGFPADG